MKSRAGSKTPRLHQSDKQRIARDALIAVTAKRAGAMVVTDNLVGFEKIKPYCKVKVISGSDYFGG
ncbi:MAG: hypothetical protein AB1631_02305 [Acidobacteriota bacterium]